MFEYIVIFAHENKNNVDVIISYTNDYNKFLMYGIKIYTPICYKQGSKDEFLQLLNNVEYIYLFPSDEEPYYKNYYLVGIYVILKDSLKHDEYKTLLSQFDKNVSINKLDCNKMIEII